MLTTKTFARLAGLAPILMLAASVAAPKPGPKATPKPTPKAVKTVPPKSARPAEPARGVYNRVDIRFELPGLQGNPFDYLENDVKVSLRRPGGGTVSVPAFFDGGTTWRVRYTPTHPGRHTIIGVTRNNKAASPDGLSPEAFTSGGALMPGFVGRDSENRRRFVFDNGTGYYPIGHNAAWGDGEKITLPGVLEKMGRAGENWSRIWMCHWDGKNLDWVPDEEITLGTLDLGVARKWDGIVEAAEKHGVRFQMVLQHHGPYSTRTDSNWGENPWNVKNGGFLATPAEFFTSPKAIALTRAKYRYIVARWGHSSSIMAWELFNEVQWTDAFRDGRQDVVAAWHDNMAAFLRSQDPYRHLVTSSFRMDPRELGDRLDYWQPHAYAPDPVAAIIALNGLEQDRPAFLGEIGPQGDQSKSSGAFIHRILWSSMMTEAAGAAQFWAWDVVERNDLYGVFLPATAFARWSGFPARRGLKALAAHVETEERGPLTIAPGAEWETAEQTEFTVSASGDVPGLGSMPRYLQGEGNRAMFPSATFHVDYPEPGAFTVRIGQVAKRGARVVVSLDGEALATREFPATEQDANVDAALEIPIPAGPHTVRLENTGADWVALRDITLDPYSSAFGAMAKGDRDYAVVWIESRGNSSRGDSSKGVPGRLVVKGLEHGSYLVRWFDTRTGQPIKDQPVSIADGAAFTVATSFSAGDIAAVIQRRAGQTVGAVASGK